MSDAFDKFAEAVGESGEEWRLYPDYYLFEGWDVKPRSQEVFTQAVEDGVDLHAPYLTQHVGEAPHPFQNGFLLSTKFFRGMMANSQSGKSLAVFMEIQMRASGKIPVAYRYPVGYDTQIERQITDENIHRWGRVSRDTGEVLDYNIKAIHEGSWYCGTVKGMGVFPSSKIVQAGGSMRLGCPQKIMQESWFPAFTGGRKDGIGKFLLPTIVDNKRGSYAMKGANKQEHQIFLCRDVNLQILTYESGAEKFEAIKVPTYLDEEPPDEDIIGAVVTHATDWSLSETPIFGITYTKKLLFPDVAKPDLQTFHSTVYDCPYKTEADIRKMRAVLHSKPWQMGARLWGVPSVQQGEPYYDRVKISLWLQKFTDKERAGYKFVTFTPSEEWHLIQTDHRISRLPGLMDVDIVMEEVKEEDKRTVWRLYEDRKDGVGYVIPSDQADGAEAVEDVGDWSTAGVGRQRDVDIDPTSPVVCATLRSSLPTAKFANEVLYAARYFNNANLAPESAKGAANAAFELVCSDWRWWFLDKVESWKSRKPKENRGFCPTQDRRETIYDILLRNWFDKFGENDYPEIPDEWILREAAGAVVGQTKGKTATRCDHPGNGTLDTLTMYGIMHFVMQKHFIKQIKTHEIKQKETKLSWWERAELAEAQRNSQQSNQALGSTIQQFR